VEAKKQSTLKEENRVRKLVEKKEHAAEQRKLKKEKIREEQALSRSRKEERVQQNKIRLKEQREKRRWHKVDRGRGQQSQQSQQSQQHHSPRTTQVPDVLWTDEEGSYSDRGGSYSDRGGYSDREASNASNTTPVRSGVDVMPCLVSKVGGSPMTPPTSPNRRRSSVGGSMTG
jgi:hypothetical protein